MKKFLKSLLYAANGIVKAFEGGVNIRVQFSLAIVVMYLSPIALSSFNEFLSVLLIIGLVISLEIVNTSIEQLCDFVCSEKSDKIKFVKDMSAGAVLFSSVIAFFIGLKLFVLNGRILKIYKYLISNVFYSVILLLIIFILTVFILRKRNGEENE